MLPSRKCNWSLYPKIYKIDKTSLPEEETMLQFLMAYEICEENSWYNYAGVPAEG